MRSSLQNPIKKNPPSFFDLKNHFKNFEKHANLLLFAFFSTLVFSFSANAQNALQPADCNHINCTSNDVRIISAYISGPGDVPINCLDAQPFHNAELHLILVTNTPRIGVSISGFLNVDNNPIPLAQCFTGVSLNDNSPNNLVYNLGSSLDAIQCGEHDFNLTNIFIAWGTGNTDFCTGTAAQCPATPAKCRFKEGETIEVDVKLDVDFDLTVGNCGQDPSNLTVTLTPTVTAENITYPLSFDWDFGDGSSHATTSAASLADVPNAGTTHTYANADTYTITLTVTDNSDPVLTRTAIHHITLATCCNLSAPTLTVGPFCVSANKTIADLPQIDGSGGTYLWFASADPNDDNDIPLLGTTVIPLGTNTYYVSLSSGGCESARAAVTVIINAAPTITGTLSVCAGSTTQLSGDGTPADTNPWVSSNTSVATVDDNGLVKGVADGSADITYTNSNGCSSKVTITVNKLPTISGTLSVCAGGKTQLTGSGTANATTPWSSDNTTVASVSSTGQVTGNSAGTATITYTDNNGCSTSVTVTINPVPSCTISNTSDPGSNTAGVGVPVNFSGPSGSGYVYLWSFTSNTSGATFSGGASTATSQSVTVTTTTTGSYTLSLKVTDQSYSTNCNKTCTYSVTVNTSNAYYTVTQGFYGNVGGKICTPSGTLYTSGSKGNVDGLIILSIKNMPGQKLALGVVSNNRTFTMGYTSQEEKNLITYLPATQTAAVITANAGSNNNTNINSNLPKIYNKKISDILLGQTITLALNVYITGNNLGNFVLQNGYLTTQKADLSSCPSKKVVKCATDATTISSLQITTNTGLKSWITSGTKKVADLLNLASNALGGANIQTLTGQSGITLSDINNAVDVINRSFDGGRFFLGYYATQQSCVTLPSSSNIANPITEAIQSKPVITTYPNPFNDKVRFVIQSPVSGKGRLEVFDMLGQKVKTVFDGQIFAGVEQSVEFNVPPANRTNLIYILRINDQQTVGKLLNVKQ